MNATAPETHDALQAQLSAYAAGLDAKDLDARTLHAAKVRVIDTLGALIGGFEGTPCRIARNLAAQAPLAGGASVIGTQVKTAPDLAAFVNGTTARYVEMNDVYHWPGSSGGHPSDVLAPVLSAAEQVHASGRDFLTALVLAYEIYLRMSDAIRTPGFDCTNFCCMGAALACGKLYALDAAQLAEALSMAVVPNNALNQARTGHLSMWKAVAAGQAGRAGVFAAQLAKAGMRGPKTPFAGKAGWFAHVARRAFELSALGGRGTGFKIHDTSIKPRASCATTISSILAAEQAASRCASVEAIDGVTVEVYERAKLGMGTGEHHWHPDARETADHSIPYVVAASLIDKRLTPASFDDARLFSAELRALLPKIEVVADADFTARYERVPVEHPTRVTVRMLDGTEIVGESGGDRGDLSQPKSDAEIEEKFRAQSASSARALSAERLGAGRTARALDALWALEREPDVAALVPLLAFE